MYGFIGAVSSLRIGVLVSLLWSGYVSITLRGVCEALPLQELCKVYMGGCPIFLYLKTTLSPCLSRTFRGLSRPKENPRKLHLTTIKASMLTHIILPFRRAFADLSRPQKSTDFNIVR